MADHGGSSIAPEPTVGTLPQDNGLQQVQQENPNEIVEALSIEEALERFITINCTTNWQMCGWDSEGILARVRVEPASDGEEQMVVIDICGSTVEHASFGINSTLESDDTEDEDEDEKMESSSEASVEDEAEIGTMAELRVENTNFKRRPNILLRWISKNTFEKECTAEALKQEMATEEEPQFVEERFSTFAVYEPLVYNIQTTILMIDDKSETIRDSNLDSEQVQKGFRNLPLLERIALAAISLGFITVYETSRQIFSLMHGLTNYFDITTWDKLRANIDRFSREMRKQRNACAHQFGHFVVAQPQLMPAIGFWDESYNPVTHWNMMEDLYPKLRQCLEEILAEVMSKKDNVYRRQINEFEAKELAKRRSHDRFLKEIEEDRQHPFPWEKPPTDDLGELPEG